jgi:DNA-binding transcriptional MerR regulator
MTMPTRTQRYSIGALARATDTKAVTIRYYEGLGLLAPAARTAAGYRSYSDADRARLQFIRRCRALGFTLGDVRELLSLADREEAPCAAVDAKVEAQLSQVQKRIQNLRALEKELNHLRSCCSGDGRIDECRIIESLSERH